MTPKQSKLHKYLFDTFKVYATEYQLQTIEKILQGKKRTVRQNSAYWGIVIPVFVTGLSKVMGETITAKIAHEFIKDRWEHILYEYAVDPIEQHPIKNLVTGETEYVMRKPSTTNITTIGEMKLYEECQKFSAQFFGEDIPSPNERDFTDTEAR